MAQTGQVCPWTGRWIDEHGHTRILLENERFPTCPMTERQVRWHVKVPADLLRRRSA